jgi:hypothetical protein
LARRPGLLVAAALALFLAGHFPWLASSLEDLDSVNFGLGVRRFDVAQHQPHPPGYPLFIGLAKLSTAAVRPWMPADAPSTSAEARGIALLNTVFGALAALPLFFFFRALDGHAWRAALAVGATLANPLFWFNASRPLSDVTGLAVALVAQALFAMAFVSQQAAARGTPGTPADREALLDSGRLFVLGAFVAGLAVGTRSQSVWLTTPLLVLVLVDRIGRDVAGALLGGVITYGLGVALWLLPLLALAGGPSGYLAAISSQAGEDLAGVDMLATNPTVRRLAFALLHTFIHPWVAVPLAVVVLAAATVGLAAVLLRERRAALLLSAALLPYALFHLVFQETFTTRYALPFVPVLAWLAVRGLSAFGGLVAGVGAAGVVVASLAVSVPATRAYSAEASPLFRALADIEAGRARAVQSGEAPVLAMHHAVARSARISAVAAQALPSPSGREWAPLVDEWLKGGEAPVWFLAESRRTDLARFDGASRRVRMEYRWPVDEATFVGGVRPGALDWVEIRSPGWFVTDGWALTPEMAGLAERDRRGPSRGGVTAWVRRRPGETVLLVGGRNLGAKGDPDVRFTLSIDGREAQQWSSAPDPGFFLHTWRLPPGTLAGEGTFAKMAITAEAADGSARAVRAAVEQFDVQPPEVPVRGFGPGWHEMEYAPSTGLRWRWTSERSTLQVIAPAGRPVELVLRGESPLRYFDRAPSVRVTAGGAVLREFAPATDFNERVVVPAEALAAGQGRVVVETSEHFVPDERTGNGDRRRLGLRVYEARVSALR